MNKPKGVDSTKDDNEAQLLDNNESVSVNEPINNLGNGIARAKRRATKTESKSIAERFLHCVNLPAFRNQDFQQTVKELKEKTEELKGVKEDLKVRTKQATEQLYKRLDGAWTEAEATAKNVSENLKEKVSAATEEGLRSRNPQNLPAHQLTNLLKDQKDKKRKGKKKGDKRAPQSNRDDYETIDIHNISLIFLKRKLVEDFLDDMETFREKIVGTFVRIRISGANQKKDIYRLVQVTGTSEAAQYTLGKRTTCTMLEILNLDKTEIISIDMKFEDIKLFGITMVGGMQAFEPEYKMLVTMMV
ncbi:hypothetical protein L2E82_49815 [Cichorium intybus]|uniref:Uncharacterized protein n=1 Tax=Cichorium intybus TaxID=13427 RepID=A0ACB8Z1X2_CICIN|nr:hypothetical protein L2E82_49815 [Cichorium intybus]